MSITGLNDIAKLIQISRLSWNKNNGRNVRIKNWKTDKNLNHQNDSNLKFIEKWDWKTSMGWLKFRRKNSNIQTTGLNVNQEIEWDYVIIRALTTLLVQWLSWVPKKERKNEDGYGGELQRVLKVRELLELDSPKMQASPQNVNCFLFWQLRW